LTGRKSFLFPLRKGKLVAPPSPGDALYTHNKSPFSGNLAKYKDKFLNFVPVYNPYILFYQKIAARAIFIIY
jgi:hypothetical protein